MKKVLSALICAALLASLCLSFVSCNRKDYKEALDLLENGKYAEAKTILEDLGDYEDCKEYLSRFHYVMTSMTYENADGVGTVEIRLNESNLPSEILVRSEGVGNSVSFMYDPQGNLIQDRTVDILGGETVSDYLYDANGYMISAVFTFSDGSHITSDFTYDENGRLLREVVNYDDANAITDYTYNANGQKIQEARTDGNGTQSTTTYTYGENGRLLQESYSVSDLYSSVTDFFYDANGYLIKEVATDSYDEQVVVEYTNDANGNVLKKVCTDAQGNQTVIEAQYALVYIPVSLPADTKDLLTICLDMF